WGNLGHKMIEAGVIDPDKFEAIYVQRGGLTDEAKNLLYGENNGRLVMNQDNSGVILNLLWGLGLGNANRILTNGPMADPIYGGAGGFASTGGWTLSRGNAMDHYSQHMFFELTEEQQELVERVANNIYRPCCNNSTYFPDCNHGMAMLGLLELMAFNGAGEEDMYRLALQANTLWFPDTYAAIDQLLELKGIDPAVVGPKEILGFDFSSASGYQQVLSQVESKDAAGNSCGV
ncbi:MAG: hypothetical protein WED06_00040, partial [Candidatus Paceibacterota bacterium]